jgi:hypothetical protein
VVAINDFAVKTGLVTSSAAIAEAVSNLLL